jgi:ribonuclease BN (tRNA processing enzyme)
VKLTVVGCAPAWTRRPGRASSCYLVEHADRAIVLDLGQGAFSELARYRRPDTISGALISHLHADHLVDLVPLRHFLKYDASGDPTVTLHGPRELRDRLDRFAGEVGFLAGLPGEALEPGTFEAGGFAIEARRVTHIPDAFAFRVSVPGESGPALVYSGDCGRANDLLPLIRPGDLFLCEAAFGGGPGEAGIHLTAAEAASVAATSGASRLVLTHLLDRSDEELARESAAKVFGGELLVARPGLELTVS